jgi:hypothetical protein
VARWPILLLDTDVSENDPDDRGITSRLYGGDAALRLKQEIVLGIGGEMLLRALGFEIATYHLNEGHAALLPLTLLPFRSLAADHSRAWLRLKQTDLIPGKGPGKGSSASVSSIRSATVVRQRFFGIPAPTPTSSERNTSGRAGWKRLARLLRCGRDRSGGWFPNAGYEPHPSCNDCSLTAWSRPVPSLDRRL